MSYSSARTRDSAGRWANLAGHAVDVLLDRTVAPGFSALGYAVRRRLPGWPADPPPGALAGRHVLVTGATSGLGAETARQCAELGAHVHLVVRDRDRGEQTAASLPGPATVWRCDVADLDSVRAFAAAFLEAGSEAAGLVHNAGTLPSHRETSPQGHELTMAVHVLGPVLMTELLRPTLAGNRARVVLVTSGGMYTQALPVDDPDYTTGDYRGAVAYARSKRTQVELLPMLAQRWEPDGISVWASHPGWADTPGVTTSLPGFARWAAPILRDAASGADTTTWLLATEPRPPSGGLWHDRSERARNMLPTTRTTYADRMQMWNWVVRAVGLPGTTLRAGADGEESTGSAPER